MGFDFGEALASGIASGAGAVEQQQQQQNDDARWLERQQKMQAMEIDAAKAKERYLLGLKPPETRKLSVTDEKGSPAVQQQEWRVTGDSGAWQDVGDRTPDINFERLAETQRNNEDRSKLASERLDLTSRLGEERIAAAQARADAAAARRTANPVEPKAYTTTDPKTGKATQVYGWFDSEGKFRQATDASGSPLGGDKFRPSVYEEKNAAQQAKVDAVKGTLSQFASAIGLGKVADALPTMNAGSAPRPSAPAAQPVPAAAAKSGSAPYSEGQTIYDKQGRRYVVKNGVPVPAP